MLVLVSFLAGGCVRSANPVLKDDQVVSNDGLLGKWVSPDGKVSAELKAGDNNQYKLTYTNEKGETSPFLVRFGKLGDTMVAEVKADAFTSQSNGEYKSLLMPLYMMVVVEKTSPQLVLSSVSADWLKKYVQANPDELDVTHVGDQDLIVNSSTEEFQAFVLRHIKDHGMLSDDSIFVHPGDPSTQPTAKP
jgi:hypothetical protein